MDSFPFLWIGTALIGCSSQQQGNDRDGMDVLYIPVKILLLNVLRFFGFLIFIRAVKLFPHPTFLPGRFLIFCVIIVNNLLKLCVRSFSSYWGSRECKICCQVLCLQWSNYMECWWLKWPESSGTNCKEWQNREVLLLQFPELCWAAAASADFNYHTPAPVPQCHPCWHQS